jgi:hypothetical protein
VSLSIDVRLARNGSALLAARLVRADAPGAGADYAGVVFAVDAATGAWAVLASVGAAAPRAAGALPAGLSPGVWHTLRLDVNGSEFSAWVDGAPVLARADASWAGATGLAGIGTLDYGHFTEFDRVALYSTQRACGARAAPAAGDALVAVPCAAEVGPRRGGQFLFRPIDASTCPFGSPCAGGAGRFALASDASLCLATAASTSTPWRVVLAPCAGAGAAAEDQVWVQDYVQLYHAQITHNASGLPLCVETPHVGSAAVVNGNGAPPNPFCGSLVFAGDEQELVSMDTQVGGFCIGTCAQEESEALT